MKCDAFLLNLSNSGDSDIVILNDSESNLIFAKDATGIWQAVARPGPQWTCGTVMEALREGQVTIRPAPAPVWPDVIVKGALLTILPTFDEESNCPK